MNDLFEIAKYRLEARIDDMADAAIAYFNNYPLRRYLKEEDDKALVDKVLKNRGYSKYGNLYTKGFVCMQTSVYKDTLQQIEVWVDVPRMNTKRSVIQESFVTGVIIAHNYYSRI